MWFFGKKKREQKKLEELESKKLEEEKKAEENKKLEEENAEENITKEEMKTQEGENIESTLQNNKEEDDNQEDLSGIKSNGKYEVFANAGGFKYRLMASNGQVLLTSEVYTSEKACKTGIQTLQKNVGLAEVRIESDKHGMNRFIVVTKQGRVLAQSANYTTVKAATSASESFKKFANSDKVVVLDNEDTSEPEKVDHLMVNTEVKGKFVYVHHQDNTYSFVLKASNGQNICASKIFKAKTSCKTALEKFKTEVYEGDFFTVKDKNNNYQFRLYSKTNRLVSTGATFDTKAKCISNIESIVRFAKFATVEEAMIEE